MKQADLLKTSAMTSTETASPPALITSKPCTKSSSLISWTMMNSNGHTRWSRQTSRSSRSSEARSSQNSSCVSKKSKRLLPRFNRKKKSRLLPWPSRKKKSRLLSKLRSLANKSSVSLPWTSSLIWTMTMRIFLRV